MEPRTSIEVALSDLGHLAFRRPFGPPDLVAWKRCWNASPSTLPTSTILRIACLGAWNPPAGFPPDPYTRPLPRRRLLMPSPMCGPLGCRSRSEFSYGNGLGVGYLQGWRSSRGMALVCGHWCNYNFPDLFAEIQASPQRDRHIRWLGIGVLAWTLWKVSNRLVIMHVPLRRATGTVFKMCGYL